MKKPNTPIINKISNTVRAMPMIDVTRPAVLKPDVSPLFLDSQDKMIPAMANPILNKNDQQKNNDAIPQHIDAIAKS